MSELLKRLRQNTVVDAQILKNSKYFDNDIRIPTRVPFLNVALSGKFKGGLPPGILQIAAPPKHFKTNFMLEIMFGFQEQKKGKDYIIILYDSELGSTADYYAKAGIDTTRVDHRPILSVEQLKSDIANLLNDIKEGDDVLICIDSLGMIRSNKEVEDAKEEHEAVDMTRAKAINSLFRIMTGESAIKQIPIIVVNHSYQTLEKFSKEVVSGGRKTQYAAHTLWFITKAQEKEGDDLAGFRFTIRAALSRYVKENSLFPIIVLFGSGVEKYSGIFDAALEHGFIVAEKQGWYKYKDAKPEDKAQRRSAIEDNAEAMEAFLNNPEFTSIVEKSYSL